MPTFSPADFDEYLRQAEPGPRERAGAWQAAIGLQAVDGLKPSAYLIETARRHIEGDITIDEVRQLVDTYYRSEEVRTQAAPGTEEADKVASNIAKLLGERTFTFSPMGFMSIHRRLFEGVFRFAGKLREHNITKKEWVLGGETVLYTSAPELRATLEYDFEQEKKFDFSGLSLDDSIAHIAKFLAGLWQIHPFAEGNTRTTAVFAIKYLRYMGFEVGNDMFAEHSWFFRNALVRANYSNQRSGVAPTLLPVTNFLRNVLLGEQHDMHNRNLHLLATYPPANQGSKNETIQAELVSFSSQDAERQRAIAKNAQVKLDAFPFLGADGKKDTKQTEQVQAERRQKRLVRALGQQELTVPELMKLLRLTARASFTKVWLAPAVQQGVVRPLFPDSPRHPRQKYLLTDKGRELLGQTVKK